MFRTKAYLRESVMVPLAVSVVMSKSEGMMHSIPVPFPESHTITKVVKYLR